MTTVCVTTKSSAVSVWILPGLAGRESVAIFPSGSPVEKEKEAAFALAIRQSSSSAPRDVLLAESSAKPSRPIRRHVGASFCVIFLLFIIVCFIFGFCVLTGAKDGHCWHLVFTGLTVASSLQTNQSRICVNVSAGEERGS